MSPHAPRLGLVELLDRDGAVAHRVPVTRWPVTIGRALDCDVVLDDPHAAAHHATLDGGVASEAGTPATLTVGASRNGLRLKGALLAAGATAQVASGAEWQIGRTRLRLRLAGEALPAELPWAALPPVQLRWLALGLALLVAWLLGERWLQSDPGDPLSGYLPVLVGLPFVLGVWCFLWAVGSKLFARHFDFLAHLRWALIVVLVLQAQDALLPLLAFALSWEWLARSGELLNLALASVLVYGHLSLVLPARRQALAVGFMILLVVGSSLKLALNHQRNDRWFAPLYLSTLGPPALRLVPPVSAEQFIDEARALREPLEKRAKDPDSPPGWLPLEEAD
ncbi:FHA domain-containing protein [Methylibium sp.]|uniref:FHA domain-containing protein n=1 Tax=Methylibium sp. TaxID=2067992 RepID=UPI00286BD475|nr:FHA domain-containing protein [Methylibium sp.]